MRPDAAASFDSTPLRDLPAPIHAPRLGLLLPGVGRLALYASRQARLHAERAAAPVLMVHSVNATASALEMAPAFERQARRRPVVALELPGFAGSARPDIRYSPALMTDAIVAAIDWMRSHVADSPVHVLALSLGSEFAAEAALRRPLDVRSIALISPTGMETHRATERHEQGRTRDVAWLRALLRRHGMGRPLYSLLTTRLSMRWFLSRSWGSRAFDAQLLDYGRACAQQPGAHHAPLDFVAGALFTRGIVERYRRLPMPVWVAHGTQGSFTDFGACPAHTGAAYAAVPLTLTRFDSGSMPHWQQPEAFDAAYDTFLDACDAAAPDALGATQRAAAAFPA